MNLDHDKINPYFYVDVDDLNVMVSIRGVALHIQGYPKKYIILKLVGMYLYLATPNNKH